MLDLSNIWPEWKVVELIGEGTFGKVYRCVREEYGMKFESAVKVISIPSSRAEIDGIRLEGFDDIQIKSYFEDIVTDFANEVKLMFMLKGAANIVSVENYKIVERKGELGWDIYIQMEYLDSFAKCSVEKRFTEAQVKDFALDIINALIICSKYKVIHRDIKPANIFVDRFGSYKLGDFGVARQLDGSVSMLSKKGTAGYMAPEVYRGDKYDFRVDIYSLGRVMYKLLNRNKEPFIDVNKQFITFRERSESFERIIRGEKLPAPVDASPEMAEVILKACEYKAENRFESLTQFKNAVAMLDVKYEDFSGELSYTEEMNYTAKGSTGFYADPPTVMMNDFGGETTQRAPYGVPFGAGDEPTVFADDEATVLAQPGDEPTELYEENNKQIKREAFKKTKSEKSKKEKIKKEDNRKPYNTAPKAIREINLYYFVIGIILVLFAFLSFRSFYYLDNGGFYVLNLIFNALFDFALIGWFVFVTLRKKLLSFITSLSVLWLFTFTRWFDLYGCLYERLIGWNISHLRAFLWLDGIIPGQIFVSIALLVVLTALSIAVYVKHNKAEQECKLSDYYPFGIKDRKTKIVGIVISAFVFLIPIVWTSIPF